ncbi:MAG: type II toxin-antitoxin system VapC family toxin, partial [Dolichospermum sp.]
APFIGAFNAIVRGASLMPKAIVDIATRAFNVIGLGWSVAQTTQSVQMLINQFDLLEETPDVFSIWFNLVTTYNISGKRTHDIHILAVMLAHNISHILTLNPKDFIAVPEITIIHPQDFI